MKMVGIIIGILFLRTSFSQGTNNALNFDGVNDYVTLDPVAAQLEGLEQFTIEFWMKSTAGPDGNGGSCMFAINRTFDNQNGLLLMIRAGGQLGVSDVAAWMGFTGTTIINDGECHHIAYVKNGLTATTYVDGELQVTALPITANHVITGANLVSLAQEWDNHPGVPIPSNFYNGDMDDLRIWNTARTGTEIADNMNTIYTGTEPGLIALYDFDQGTIAGGNNTSETSLVNLTPAGATLDGSFNNLTLNGPSSNFVLRDCGCSANTDSLFTTVNEDISSDTYWTGKIYIPDNTIIEVSNDAILDITNVDVVFGQCAGIDFIDGAILRANNSVFRPCDLNDSWRGLRFDRTTEKAHQINESTFKNAEIALNFDGNSDAVVNANTLINCNEGLFLSNSNLIAQMSIISNSFVTNSEFPEYTNCYEFTDPNDVIHIHVDGVGLIGIEQLPIVIAQNSMVMTNQFRNINTTAIDLLSASASISENKMTDMTDGIIIQNPMGETNIENNELEITNIYNNTALTSSQISIFNARGPFVRIDNNELSNSDHLTGIVRGAIYLENSSNIIVEHNEIGGFDIGISAQHSPNVNISENTLSSILNTGIYLEEGLVAGRNFITCNDITMVMGQGVSVSTNGASALTQITSNCLKDGHEGIRTEGTGTIPFIRNNYLYNYSTGISNIGHSGNIGTSFDPGLNTLWSNDNSAIDILSTTPLDVADNFGMFNITFATVTITSGNPYHSTASCGHQIFNMPSQGNLNVEYTCDNSVSASSPLVRSENTTLLPSYEEALAYFEASNNPSVGLNKIASHPDCTEGYLSKLIEVCEISGLEKGKIWYNFYKTHGDLSNALLQLEGVEDERFKSIEMLHLKVLNGDQLSAEEFEYLNLMANDETVDGITNQAVTLTKLGANRSSYRYTYPAFEPNTVNISVSERFEEDVIKLKAFPNPADDVITVQILNGQDVENQTLMVYNIYGELIMTQKINFIAGQVVVDVASLAAGNYYVTLASEDGHNATCKFVKK